MSAQPTRRVMVCLGKSAPSDGGIFEFSSQLAQRIVQGSQAWLERDGVAFTFHVRPELLGCFGPATAAIDYRPLVKLQRLRHAQPRPYALWHSTHQLNKFKPPVYCPQRLVTVHDLNYRYGRNAWSTWREGRRMRGLISRADALVAISQHTAQDVRQHLSWRGPLEVVYNGVRSLVGHAQEALPGVDIRKPFLLHLSRMTPSKNPQALLALASQWPHMQFVMCGAPSEDAKRLARDNRLPNVQYHLGINDGQKAWAYAHCAGFLFPSLTEGFGLPPIEAMHFGRPVFLSRLTSLPEVGGEAAEYFDDFSPAAMRAVVQRGLERHRNEQREAKVQAHARQFSWDAAAQRYLALYRQLLNLPPLA